MAAQDRSAPQEAHRRLVDLMNEAVAARKGTRAALATKAGISAGALSNALSGHAVPNFLTVQQIADALDVPEEEWREWSRLRDRADPVPTARRRGTKRAGGSSTATWPPPTRPRACTRTRDSRPQ